jgi:hypothetical protein
MPDRFCAEVASVRVKKADSRSRWLFVFINYVEFVLRPAGKYMV